MSKLVLAVSLELLCLCLNIAATTARNATAWNACARVLMIVAHADDETLFGGELLSGQASLPNGCRRANWRVISATANRASEFHNALAVAVDVGRAGSISGELWGYEDCNHESCQFWGPDPPIEQKIRRLLQSESWDFVITHNYQGEYGHVQHALLHRIVFQAYQKALSKQGSTLRPENILVFNPIPEIDVTISSVKLAMCYKYFPQDENHNWGGASAVDRGRVFADLIQNSEHIVPHLYFTRSESLRLAFAPGRSGLHFCYAWPTLNSREWPHGQFTVDKAMSLATDWLRETFALSCNRQSKRNMVHYPRICNGINHHLERKSEFLQQCLKQLSKIANLISETSWKQTESPPSEQCLEAKPFGRFGAINSVDVLSNRSQPFWIQLHLMRPIRVGWNHGYKSRTWKFLYSTEQENVDVEQAKYRIWFPAVKVQPQDVLGWSVFEGNVEKPSSSTSSIGSVGSWCVGARKCAKAPFSGEVTECMCVFDVAMQSIGYLIEHLGFDVNVVALPNSRSVQRPNPGKYSVRPSLDIADYIEATTSYEELMTLRQGLQHPDLAVFEDKIRLRRELLPSLDVLSTPSIHLSTIDFNVARHLEGRTTYVVKPSHMSESQNVFVVMNGINLLQLAWGHPDPQVSIEHIQKAARSFRNLSALDWECRALAATKPGVIVEELVLSERPDGKTYVDEYKFYTVWGEVFFGESVPFSSGSTIEAMRDGTIFTTVGTCPPYCVSPCYKDMVAIAEKVAQGARTDFLRVDILIQGRCEGLYVSEVELFPASNFSLDLKLAVAEKWRAGYGVVT